MNSRDSTTTYNVNADDTPITLKYAIQIKQGIEVNKQRLYHNGVRVDMRTEELTDLGIGNGSILQMLVQDSGQRSGVVSMSSQLNDPWSSAMPSRPNNRGDLGGSQV